MSEVVAEFERCYNSYGREPTAQFTTSTCYRIIHDEPVPRRAVNTFDCKISRLVRSSRRPPSTHSWDLAVEIRVLGAEAATRDEMARVYDYIVPFTIPVVSLIQPPVY